MGWNKISKEIIVIVVGLFIALTSYLLVAMGIIITSLAWFVCAAYLLSVACVYLYRRSVNKNIQLKDIYLTGKDIGDKHSVKPFELKQRVENGMPAYIQTSEGYRTDNLRVVSERDLIACEEWPQDKVNSWIEQWRFKTGDVKKYMKTT